VGPCATLRLCISHVKKTHQFSDERIPSGGGHYLLLLFLFPPPSLLLVLAFFEATGDGSLYGDLFGFGPGGARRKSCHLKFLARGLVVVFLFNSLFRRCWNFIPAGDIGGGVGVFNRLPDGGYT